MSRNCAFILLVWLVLFFVVRVEAQTSQPFAQTKIKRHLFYTPTLEENLRFRIEFERRVNAGILRALGMKEAAEEYEAHVKNVQNQFFPKSEERK